ncbi:SEC-C domain-containing protein [Thiococcus pfennigii]|uniref:SEC-C domain-containing protein n=1 Tax=Thiococcus pfennigii TaxID=1057 RepID=UPI0019030E07|nr:SEC-C domain-containing protein [Thiococcus pfennigii]MBK1702308.1 hypothetical protein [Thiococcus pfennigii]MBK1730662.1 hypothetical protein [Thiococcus pfennigii]
MFHQETHDGERIEGLIIEALQEILTGQDAERFIAWAQRRVPEVLRLGEAPLSAAEIRRVATLLAAAIWRATPRPDRDFQTVPLLAREDAPCPCGSEEPFEACCGRTDELPDLSSDVIWELLLAELSERELQRALALAVVPDHLQAKVAERWLELDHPLRAVALLEALLGQPDAAHAELALEVLCDAYDRLDHWKKKRAFLTRMTRSDERTLRGAAWRRLSAGRLDEGDFAAAHEAFVQALRQTPDDPALAFLEIALLTAQHRDEEARRRAELWRYRLVRNGLDDEDILTFLGQAAADPQEALMTSQRPVLDPALIRLHDWLRTIATRPVPRHRLTPLPLGQDEAPSGQLELFSPDEVPARRRPYELPGTEAQLRPGAGLSRLETAWHQVFKAAKPFSTDLAPADDEHAWIGGDWLEFLAHHPEAGDSLDVLDDLATAIFSHPESALPWVVRALLPPLLERAAAIVEKAVPRASSRTIPWRAARNQPALRLLFRHYLYLIEADRPGRATAVLEDLLRLNPRDNHGVRADLMNHYLRERRDDEALELARRFPDDRLADLIYGEVLALYRLGEPERAAQALDLAVGRLPSIPAYLTRQRIKPPQPPRWPSAPSGEVQAWLYREAMRDVWAAEPGILAWLKRLTA